MRVVFIGGIFLFLALAGFIVVRGLDRGDETAAVSDAASETTTHSQNKSQIAVPVAKPNTMTSVAAESPRNVASIPRPQNIDPGIRVDGENVRITAAAWQTKMAGENLKDTFKGTFAKPYKEGNQDKGILLTKIPQGSFLEMVGFRPSDVIEEINGEKVADPNAALHTLQQDGITELQVRVVRGNSTFVKVISVGQ